MSLPPILAMDDARWRAYLENSRRMVMYNRHRAAIAYRGGVMPAPPKLIDAAGAEIDYTPSSVVPAGKEGEEQNPSPVGKGPDRWGCYEVAGPDHNPLWALYMTPDGSVYFKGEMPDPEGRWVLCWFKIT